MESLKGIQIPQPCSASWNAMTPEKEGRFCNTCSKRVMDFSTKSLSEIKDYFKAHLGKRICGRFRKDQLDPTEPIDKHRYVQQSPPLWIFAVALFYAFGASLFDIDKHPLTDPPCELVSGADKVETVVGMIMPSAFDRMEGGHVHGQSGLVVADSAEKMKEMHVLFPDRDPLRTDTDSLNLTKRLQFNADEGLEDSTRRLTDLTAEKRDSNFLVGMVLMPVPVFPGGDKALGEFIVSNVNYPEGADSLREGTVIVQFKVLETGKVADPVIIKHLAPAFDEEVLRVVRLMPDFIPAKQNGKAIASQFNLPVRFKR
jgi:TonB family protein